MSRSLFTSESVSMGHPDKVADQVSDAVLDALLEQDPSSRVACETMVTTGVCIIAGEITTKAVVNYQDIVRGTLRSIGYTDDAYGINADTCAVMVTLDRQSPDIAQGVDDDKGLHVEQGAGDVVWNVRDHLGGRRAIWKCQGNAENIAFAERKPWLSCVSLLET